MIVGGGGVYVGDRRRSVGWMIGDRVDDCAKEPILTLCMI